MLDHIFVFIEPDGDDCARMEAFGLVESYRRVHPGQGTRNVCYGFDNVFLELLWVDDPEAALSPAISRTRLFERSRWRVQDSCPFGIAWRSGRPSSLPPVPTWSFSPPYLPQGMSISVATDSDDPRQPMLFQSPGSTAPRDWPPEKRGQLQHDNGYGCVRSIALTLPSACTPCEALVTLAEHCSPPITLRQGADYGLEMRIERLDGTADAVLTFGG